VELVAKIDEFVENDNRNARPFGRLPRIRSLPKSSNYVNVFPGQQLVLV
jgi:hypothetical protein